MHQWCCCVLQMTHAETTQDSKVTRSLSVKRSSVRFTPYICEGGKDRCLDKRVHLWSAEVGLLVSKVGPGTQTLKVRNGNNRPCKQQQQQQMSDILHQHTAVTLTHTTLAQLCFVWDPVSRNVSRNVSK